MNRDVHYQPFWKRLIWRVIVSLGLLLVTTANVAADRAAPPASGTPVVEDAPGPGASFSPRFGRLVTWSAEWTWNRQASRQNSTDQIDYLSLRFQPDDGSLFNAIFLQSNDSSLESYVDLMLEFRTKTAGGKGRTVMLLDQDVRTGIAALVYAEFMASGDHFTTTSMEIQVLDDGAAFQVVEVVSKDPALTDVFATAQDSILINGEPPFRRPHPLPATPAPSSSGGTGRTGDANTPEPRTQANNLGACRQRHWRSHCALP